jgi:hypothetical protein
VQYNTPQMQEFAKEMLAKQQDYSPAADLVLSANRALCSYGSEAWIVDTHDGVSMKLYTKIERII